MADKSPRQGMSKKSDKTLKQKRAEKHAKEPGAVSGAQSLGTKKK